MKYFLALDAGGTRTECLVADEERVLARASAGTVKLMTVGAQEATARLRSLVLQVAAEGGVQLDAVTRTCAGFAGISSDGVRTWAEIALTELAGGDLLLTGDDEIALEAAFGEGPGVLVVAGTGSRVVGRCSNRTRMTVGGWGPMLGDEGSGNWIGIEAIRSSLRARDRGVPSTLLREILAAWDLDSVGGLIAKANQRPRPDYSQLAEVVGACASGGDALATSVLERAGEELAAQVGVVFSKMAAAGCATSDMARVAFTGGILSLAPHVLATMSATVQRLYPPTRVDREAVDPIDGALARARRG